MELCCIIYFAMPLLLANICHLALDVIAELNLAQLRADSSLFIGQNLPEALTLSISFLGSNLSINGIPVRSYHQEAIFNGSHGNSTWFEEVINY